MDSELVILATVSNSSELSILKTELISEDRFSIVRKPIFLFVDILERPVTKDLSITKFDFACVKELSLLDVETKSCFLSSLAYTLLLLN